MEAPYRKLFNLFAFSILALAVYINFLHKEEEPASIKKVNSTYQQATMVSKSKPVAMENNKSLLSKEEKKN
jgi:hypothetical protein